MGLDLSIVVAVSKNGVIGDGLAMPWHLPADLRHFKQTTLNKIVVMGRKTFDSIGRPLPDRENIVVSRQGTQILEKLPVTAAQSSLHVCDSLAQSMALCEHLVDSDAGVDREVMIIGGGQLYRAFLPYVSRLYLTRVGVEIEGAVSFPELDYVEWEKVSVQHRPADEKNAYDCDFETYRRVANGRPYRELFNGESHHVQALV